MASGSQAGQAGQPRLTKGARITGDQRSSLAETFGTRYAGGESIRSIAEDTGRSYGFVHGVLKESGASLRGRGGATRGQRQAPVDHVDDQVAASTDGLASPARTKAKASKAAEKNGAKPKAKDAKPKAVAKDGKAKKTVEASRPGKKPAKKSHKKG